MQSMCEKGLKYVTSEGLVLGTVNEFRYISRLISCNVISFKIEAQNWLVKFTFSQFRILFGNFQFWLIQFGFWLKTEIFKIPQSGLGDKKG
jgi:hypothetical protein